MMMKSLSFFFLFLSCIAQKTGGNITPSCSRVVESCTPENNIITPTAIPTIGPDNEDIRIVGITSFTALPINPQFVELNWAIQFNQLFDRKSIKGLNLHLMDDGAKSYADAANDGYSHEYAIPQPIFVSIVPSNNGPYILGPLKSGQSYCIKLSLVFNTSRIRNDCELNGNCQIIKSKHVSVAVQACDLDCNEPKGIINFGCTGCTCKTNSYGGEHCKEPMFASTITYIGLIGRNKLEVYWHHNSDLHSDIEITSFTIIATDIRSNKTERMSLNSNTTTATIGSLEEEGLYSIAVMTNTSNDFAISNALTIMMPNDFSPMILLPSFSTPIIVASSPAQPQAASDAVAGIVLVVLAIVIISIHTCSPLIVIICVQKRKIRQYEADRTAATNPAEPELQGGHATLLSAYNIVSHDNPAYTPSVTSNGHHHLPEYQNSDATISTTNQLYVNSEVETTSETVHEPESRSTTSTLMYDYIPSSRSIIQ